ncbi:hypothetical protein ACO0LM_22175 [Undibacterium sp. Di26W]|uniref:hypothetical protein n=1 Tax=Undibacterium sp. Di26W TaxID=3413035 RepID=UPI003BF37C08
MTSPYYIGLKQARAALAEIGIELNERQIKRAADPDAHGIRKLPFFVDPIDGRLKIERGKLLFTYKQCQEQAEINSRVGFHNERKKNAAD